MKTFVLKLRTNADAENGVAVVSKSDDTLVLREYHKKDEILRTYEDNIAYSWFVVSVSENEVIYVNNQKWRRYCNTCDGIKDTIYVNPTAELFKHVKGNIELLPENYMDALETSLKEIFKFPVFRSENRGWSSASVFVRYIHVLYRLKKTANDFVEQHVIDEFVRKMIKVYARSEIKSMLNGKCAFVSKEVEAEIEVLNKEMSEISSLAFDCAIAGSKVHNWCTEWDGSISYKGKTLDIKVNQDHVYLQVPYGKGSVSECVGWLFD